MRLFISIQTLILVIAGSQAAYAHGMVYDIKKDNAVVISAQYDDGEPMSYADVKIYSPENQTIEHQNGRTDKNGRFAFMPDTSGNWQITVDGGMGHVIKAEFTVDASSEINTEKIQRAFPRWMGVVAGLGFIFGITGWIHYFRARKLKMQTDGSHRL